MWEYEIQCAPGLQKPSPNIHQCRFQTILMMMMNWMSLAWISLAFMGLLTAIEKDVGYIPRAILEGDIYPETFGELVSAYDVQGAK